MNLEPFEIYSKHSYGESDFRFPYLLEIIKLFNVTKGDNNGK